MDEEPKVVPLHSVPKPKAEESVRKDVLHLLEQLLALARDGEISSVFIVASHVDGTYSEAISKTLAFGQMIGQVEVVKQNWIGRYLASQQGRPVG